jgi:hypothetical protein
MTLDEARYVWTHSDFYSHETVMWAARILDGVGELKG